MVLKIRPFSCVYFPKIYHRKTRLDIMVLMMNYKYDNPQSLLRVILCQINRFENKPLREDILYFSYLFFVFQSINKKKLINMHSMWTIYSVQRKNMWMDQLKA